MSQQATSGEDIHSGSNAIPAKDIVVPFYDDGEVGDSFALGFDPFSAEEVARRQNRAARFKTEYVDPSQLKSDSHQSYIDPTTSVPGLGSSIADIEAARARHDRFSGTFSSTQADLFASNDMADTFESTMPMILAGNGIDHIDKTDLDQEFDSFDPRHKRRWSVIHIVGPAMLALNMTTKDILDRFSGYGAQGVEWISDYRCNVRFSDPHSCRRALNAFSTLRGVDLIRAETYIVDNAIEVDFAQEDLEFVIWRSVTPSAWKLNFNSHVDDRGGRRRRDDRRRHRDDGRDKDHNWVHPDKRHLSMRIATEQDVKRHYTQRSASTFYRDNFALYNDLRLKRREKAMEEINEHERDIALAAGLPYDESSMLTMDNDQQQQPVEKIDYDSIPENIIPLETQEFINEKGVVCRGRGFNTDKLPIGALEATKNISAVEDPALAATTAATESVSPHFGHTIRVELKSSRGRERKEKDWERKKPSSSSDRGRDRSRDRDHSRDKKRDYSRDRNSSSSRYNRNRDYDNDHETERSTRNISIRSSTRIPSNRNLSQSYLEYDRLSEDAKLRPRMLNITQDHSQSHAGEMGEHVRSRGNFLPIEPEAQGTNLMFKRDMERKELEAARLEEERAEKERQEAMAELELQRQHQQIIEEAELAQLRLQQHGGYSTVDAIQQQQFDQQQQQQYEHEQQQQQQQLDQQQQHEQQTYVDEAYEENYDEI